jgi:hypothetical protein
MKDLIDSKSDDELYQSIIAESAKASAELRSATSDIEKASNRIKFVLMLAHKLKDRKKD